MIRSPCNLASQPVVLLRICSMLGARTGLERLRGSTHLPTLRVPQKVHYILDLSLLQPGIVLTDSLHETCYHKVTRSPQREARILLPGVQKERMQPEDMYVLNPDGSHLEVPLQKPYPAKKVKCSDCHPLFLEVATLDHLLFSSRSICALLVHRSMCPIYRETHSTYGHFVEC